MAYRTWTDKQLIDAIKSSKTISEVISKIGLNSRNSGNYQSVNKKIEELKLDTSHFVKNIVGIKSKPRELKEILIENSLCGSTTNLKERIIKEGLLEEKCNECSLIYWRGCKLSLHLDHINGIRSDNRIENLRLLCPNCHSLTPTYCRGIRRKKKYTCQDCGCEVSRKSIKCKKCDCKRKQKIDSLTKIKWPPVEELVSMVEKLGCVKVGKLLGVSDKSVKKRIVTRSDLLIR